tara:strand:+ start:290 stop:850 length:561 start_codon:yes stop_codon:yes gene_type:complete
MNERAQAIIDFWFDDMFVEKRFKKDEKFDNLIKEKFQEDHNKAIANEYDDWQDKPLSTLALVILLDQFSRNLYRDDKRAFAQDQKARLIVNDAVYNGYLDEMDEYQRFFMLLPYIHSEEIIDHDRAYKLLDNYLSDHPNVTEIKKFWKDHTAAIKRFHRYPHRNKIIGRRSTPEEIQFLEGPNSSW